MNVLFLTVLSRYNSHATQFTYLKCTIQWLFGILCYRLLYVVKHIQHEICHFQCTRGMNYIPGPHSCHHCSQNFVITLPQTETLSPPPTPPHPGHRLLLPPCPPPGDLSPASVSTSLPPRGTSDGWHRVGRPQGSCRPCLCRNSIPGCGRALSLSPLCGVRLLLCPWTLGLLPSLVIMQAVWL